MITLSNNYSDYFSFHSRFIEIQVVYKSQHIISMYRLVSLGIQIHSGNHTLEFVHSRLRYSIALDLLVYLNLNVFQVSALDILRRLTYIFWYYLVDN